MRWIPTILGVALVAVTLRDMVHTLFRPMGSGSLSELVLRTVWRLVRLRGPRSKLLHVAGPAALLSVLGFWTLMLTAGWALVYAPHMPEGFAFSSPVPSHARHGFSTALYTSIVALSTLGFGDVTPTATWLRFLVPLEALIGFVLLTSGLTWILSVYPVLAHQRSLALEITAVRRTERTLGRSLLTLEGDAPAEKIVALTKMVERMRSELTQFPVAYYFWIDDADASVAARIGELVSLAREATKPERPINVRFAGTMLSLAIDDFARQLATEFLKCRGAPTDEVLRAFARDHYKDDPACGIRT